MKEIKHNPWQSQASLPFYETDAQNFYLPFVGFCGRWSHYVTRMSQLVSERAMASKNRILILIQFGLVFPGASYCLLRSVFSVRHSYKCFFPS